MNKVMNVFQWKAASLIAEGSELPHATANYGVHCINDRNTSTQFGIGNVITFLNHQIQYIPATAL
jgi:hypothetical protein